MTRLTKRETQVAALLGKTNAEIAARLCISELPVSDHVKAILRKTGATTRTEAALILHREEDIRGRWVLLQQLVGMAG